MSERTPDPGSQDALRRENAALAEQVVRLQAEISVLRGNADRYKTLYDALPVSVYVVDREGIIAGVNPFHLETMGKGRTAEADYVGKPAATRPSIVAAGVAWTVAHLLRGEPFAVEDVHFPALSGGGEAWCDLRGVPLFSNGEVVGGIIMTTVVTAYHQAKEELRRHVEKLEKTLSGFIPICASCKRVRDADGGWSRLEEYLREHAEIEFTHGVCPECARKLYPGLTIDR